MQFPPAEDSLTGAEPGGLHDSLAKQGIGLILYDIAIGGKNLRSGYKDGEQQFLGQDQTWLNTISATLIFDLQRYGIENGQFVLAGNMVRTNWNEMGPRRTALENAYYYQTLLDGGIELKAGYIANTYDYYGQFMAGSISSSIFGSSATGPAQMGMSGPATPKPAFNVTFNRGNFYNEVGYQRSTSPDGYVQEQDDNPTAFKWSTPNGGDLYIDEFGYRSAPTSSSLASWWRAGYMHNKAKFLNYKTGERDSGNEGYYLLADQQLLRFGSGPLAMRGIYGGFTVFQGDDEYNAIDKTYELRLYAVGPFASRPTDMISLIATRNGYNDNLTDGLSLQGIPHTEKNTTITLGYNGRVTNGIRAGIGLAYVDHPLFTYPEGEDKESLTLLTSLFFNF